MHISDAQIQALQQKRYWPWPLALAYLQSKREVVVAAVSEVLSTYPTEQTLSEFTASSAVARLYEVTTGKTYGEDPDTYWLEIEKLEAPLIAALEAGQISAFGRRTSNEGLSEIDCGEWVGREVLPERTSDLVGRGWRSTNILDQTLNLDAKSVSFYDLHLIGVAVRQLGDAIDARKSAALSDEIHGVAFSEIERLEQEGCQLRRGYWSPLIAGAWIASRSETFTAAIQQFEKNSLCERGGAHSWSAWWAVGDLLGKRFGITLTGTHELLREVLEAGDLEGGKGVSVSTKKSRLIKQHEWSQWEVSHNSAGSVVIPHTYDVGWPAKSVQSAFPARLADKSDQGDAPTEKRSGATLKEILERCDELWLQGINVRKIEQLIPKENRFLGVKATLIRALTLERYKRVGRGGVRTPDMIVR